MVDNFQNFRRHVITIGLRSKCDVDGHFFTFALFIATVTSYQRIKYDVTVSMLHTAFVFRMQKSINVHGTRVHGSAIFRFGRSFQVIMTALDMLLQIIKKTVSQIIHWILDFSITNHTLDT